MDLSKHLGTMDRANDAFKKRSEHQSEMVSAGLQNAVWYVIRSHRLHAVHPVQCFLTSLGDCKWATLIGQ